MKSIKDFKDFKDFWKTNLSFFGRKTAMFWTKICQFLDKKLPFFGRKSAIFGRKTAIFWTKNCQFLDKKLPFFSKTASSSSFVSISMSGKWIKWRILKLSKVQWSANEFEDLDSALKSRKGQRMMNDYQTKGLWSLTNDRAENWTFSKCHVIRESVKLFWEHVIKMTMNLI